MTQCSAFSKQTLSQAQLQLLCVGFPCSEEKKIFMQLGKKQPCVFLMLAFCKQGPRLPVLGIWQAAPTHPDEDVPLEGFYTYSYTWSFRAGGTAEILLVILQGRRPKEG